MKIALSIFLGLFLVSCSEDATGPNKEAKSSGKPESIYTKSNITLSSEQDSISYTLGFEISKPFITDTVFSKLNLIYSKKYSGLKKRLTYAFRNTSFLQ